MVLKQKLKKRRKSISKIKNKLKITGKNLDLIEYYLNITRIKLEVSKVAMLSSDNNLYMPHNVP